MMKVVKTTQNGIDYLAAVLLEKRLVVTRSVFWKVPHNSGAETIHLKIGRYSKNGFNNETLQVQRPKSELTLDSRELENLLSFISENYEPFRVGVKKYISLDESFSGKNLEHIRSIFRNPNKERLLQFIVENDVLPEELVIDIQHQRRLKAVQDFERNLSKDSLEHVWQRWFRVNNWVLGSDFVRVLDERTIDPGNVADYLVQAYDGFLDIIEIKRPGGGLLFWARSQDHNNYVPSTDLTKAITQATKYIFEVEREVNSQKFLERIGGVPTVKPRCVLVFGRSIDWNEEQKKAYRILNSSYHNLTIMTYDHVLARARRLLGIDATSTESKSAIDDDQFDDIPF